MWNGKANNNRFILLFVSVTEIGAAALPLLLSPQFSHRSPIVFPFQKENWGRTEVEGWTHERTKGSAKGTWMQVGEDSWKWAYFEKE